MNISLLTDARHSFTNRSRMRKRFFVLCAPPIVILFCHYLNFSVIYSFTVLIRSTKNIITGFLYTSKEYWVEWKAVEATAEEAIAGWVRGHVA